MAIPASRRGGVLLHVTSLPGPEGIGTLGRAAREWIDFLEKAGMKIWQVLPVGPTGYGESPYQGACAVAGNPYLIDLETLHEQGDLPDYEPAQRTPSRQVDFAAVMAEKDAWLRRAYEHRKAALRRQKVFAQWCEKWPWLHDYALFMAVKRHFSLMSWMDWPDEAIRMREPAAMKKYEKLLRDDVEFYMYLQFVFHAQWDALHDYAHLHGVSILGDMPIYVAEDSSDVWANWQYFQLDETRHPRRVAGVPPDYFSEDGQMWGNPLYRWSELRRHGYRFWIDRLRAMGEMYDSVRIDHFIGFANYYSIQYGRPNARIGHWVLAPGKDFFAKVKKELPELDIVAEDLGAVNDRVRDLIAFCGYPGMKLLQFAFGGDPEENPHDMSHITENCIAYTGTHDNDTTLGWWRACDAGTRGLAREALGSLNDHTIVWRLIETTFACRANTAIAPMQDFLELDSDCRMNNPGTVGGINWKFRCLPGDLSDALAQRMRALNHDAGRL